MMGAAMKLYKTGLCLTREEMDRAEIEGRRRGLKWDQMMRLAVREALRKGEETGDRPTIGERPGAKIATFFIIREDERDRVIAISERLDIDPAEWLENALASRWGRIPSGECPRFFASREISEKVAPKDKSV